MTIDAPLAIGKVIGFVRQVIGEVTATGSDGVIRVLQVGDLVFADERIETAKLGSIEIAFNDGGNFTLGRNAQGFLDVDVYQTTSPEDASEYAVSIEAIQQAILMGDGPAAIQEAPAAGPGDAAIAGNEGTSFVTVERTGNQTTPESGFETEGLLIAFEQPEDSFQVINLFPSVDLDGDDNSQIGAGYLSHYVEQGGSLPIADTDIQVANPDDTLLKNATIVLTNAQVGDQLDVSTITGLSVEVDTNVPGVITVTLIGTATPQAYAEGIRSIGFSNDSSNPDETPRIIEVTVNDGEFDSNTAITTITVQAINDPPAVDLDANDTTDNGNDYLTTFTEGGAAIAIADIDTLVLDIDNSVLQSAKVTLTNPHQEDLLDFGALSIGLSATVSGNTITISGEGSTVEYQNAIRAITFENTSNSPSGETRVIHVTVNDGELDSAIAIARIAVRDINDIAELDLDSSASGNGYETTFIEDGAAVSIANNNVAIVDVDDENIESATIVLTNPQASDVLVVSGLPNGITATVIGSTVTLTGTAALSSYEQALQVIRFSNISDDPSTVDRLLNITLNDGDVNGGTVVTIIHVTPVNDPPDAINDFVSTQEDTPVSISVLGNDSDPEGDQLSVTSNTQPANGTLVQIANGSFQYTPNTGFFGTDIFSCTISDGNGGMDTATVTVTVGGVNDAPVAVDDTVGANEDAPVTVAVLANDSDPDGDTLTITSVTQGTNGTITIDSVSGNPLYTPNLNFNGTDTFTYTIDDGNGGTDTATVTVTVGGVNHTPVAVDDTVSTAEDNPVTVDVLPNDTDPDGDTLTVTSVTQGTNGSVAIDLVSGNPVYTPNSNFNGTDTFTCSIDDGNGGTDTATVTVTVGGLNDAPVAIDDTVGTNEDIPVTVTVLPNDTDPDGDTLTVTSVTQGANGSVVIDPVSGNPIYTPNLDFNGTDIFTYTVDDGNGATDTATVTVTVGGVNDTPVAVDDTVNTVEDNPITVDVLPNDSEPDGDTLTVTSVTQGTNGSVSIDPVSGNPIYTPNLNFNGTDAFTYSVDDGNGATDTATVTVSVGSVNDTPVAVDDAVGTNEVVPVIIDVLPNDSDLDGDILSITSVTQGTNGTVAIDPISGNPVYTPNLNFNGTDTFTYTIDDGNGGTDTATVTITVGSVNDAPVAVDDTVGTNEDAPVTVAVLPNDSDQDGDTLSITLVTQGTNGFVSIDLVSGNPVYTPNLNFNGTDTFTYTIDDGNGGTDTAKVTVTVGGVNDAPVAVDDTVGTNEDVPVTVVVLPNDSDPEGDILTVISVIQGTNGTVTIDLVSGNPIYTPNLNFNGTDTFTYTIDDGNGGTDTATVTVTVGGNDDASVVSPTTAVVSKEGLLNSMPDSSGVPRGTSESATYSDSMAVSDPDGDALTLTLAEPGISLTFFGQRANWTGVGTDTLIRSASGAEVIRVTIDQTGNYTVILSERVDHPVSGQEDIISFNVDVAADDGANSATAPLTIRIEDDSPQATDITANMYIGVDSIEVQNLAAGWINPVFINGPGDVTQLNTDTDGFIDNLLWGQVSAGASQSGYTLVDNLVFLGAGTPIQICESFKLAGFSHNNWPIFSSSSILDQVTLTMEMDVVINGASSTVQFNVLVDHDETPNNGPDPRDIITLPAQAVTITIGGQDYEVRIDGFRDTNGQIVTIIFTDEPAINPLEIMGNIVSTDPLPIASGSVSNLTGGDGSISNVTWGDASSTFADLTVDSSGAYSFELNRVTKDGLAPGQTIIDSFSYSITDEDGDISSSTLTITISGFQSIDPSAANDNLRGTAADEYLAGYEGDDVLRGNGGDDVLDGGAGSDSLRGGRGDDTLIFDAADTRITGNSGFDTLLVSDNDDLDFSGISNIRNIERIDLTVGDHDISNLSAADLLTMTDGDNLLEILGDYADNVELSNDWHATGYTFTQNGHQFAEFNNAGNSVTLLIEDQVNVTII
ncbi:MAG: retention module-containing protein [Candidatus Thiodiazotropha sp. (ex Lucinoma aequizonata)]|nr:retention module-containing protein [Candidatus Thiodiazotropha sp. (ex Lucinoma aequizonata)]MCU7889484.1 retention module-containing protein [Candidatus Thiodiazotropha sp. (ex Lucinoma aequizonata)]MCU7896673.1 retention module-containing protein [Candidatus Thiodiazotropha sp. (ex Lucinoma aequizonata)]MCU7898060.1 retention module-containing protein [Candidatus Thiodiazotropha sp. (ex Lucinoma aequizonata)]MCU7901080.1 retention module-containing protein [Candidatus Thiodiazotropha sp. 